VHFIDDVNLEARPTGADVDIAPQLANLINPAIARTVEFQNVDIFATGNREADIALVAGVGSGPLLAVEAFRKDSGGGSFPGSAGARKEVGMAHATLLNRIAQGSHNMSLANQITECLRTIPPSDNRVGTS